MRYINDQDLNRDNTNINDLSEVILKDFQSNINNKILVKKTFLHKIRKVEDIYVHIVNRNQKQFYIYLLNAIKSKNFGNLYIYG